MTQETAFHFDLPPSDSKKKRSIYNEAYEPESQQKRWCRRCNAYRTFRLTETGEFFKCEKCGDLIINIHNRKKRKIPDVDLNASTEEPHILE